MDREREGMYGEVRQLLLGDPKGYELRYQPVLEGH